jgi:predicted lysophospholipase L1 biosynthesis ABC-type transport system permease subunit
VVVADLHGRRRRHRGVNGQVAVPAVTAALIAGSVALLGFGLDSVIEGLASIIIVWRFTGTRTLSETAERRAQKAVAVTFFLLAPYIAIDAIHSPITAEHAKTSWLGIGLSIASLILLPRGRRRDRQQPGCPAEAVHDDSQASAWRHAGDLQAGPGGPVDEGTARAAGR